MGFVFAEGSLFWMFEENPVEVTAAENLSKLIGSPFFIFDNLFDIKRGGFFKLLIQSIFMHSYWVYDVKGTYWVIKHRIRLRHLDKSS
ncbi:hypothetical protein [Winogradskyella sp.]|uniref:hypothetical protein n=1 Tax=Winogradskyella sp. TaxID=1883156 RepID=UPI002618646B|nr:hypothetical protein [Winogradskyella sp.]